MLGNRVGRPRSKHNVTEYFVVWLLRAKLKICKSQRDNQKEGNVQKENDRVRFATTRKKVGNETEMIWLRTMCVRYGIRSVDIYIMGSCFLCSL